MSESTTHRRAECPRCLRAQSACICQFAARIDSALELLILQHPMEVRTAKGTARLLHLSLPNSVIAVGEAFDPDALRAMLHADGRTPVLLYPPSGDSAERCTPQQLPPSAVRLVVVDGTWRKSRKMLYLNPILQSLPRLALEDVSPSAYRIRKAHAAHQLSTLEAAACAIAAIDPSVNVQPLLDGFESFMHQQTGLATRPAP